ncbi:Tricarboxylate transport protein TctC [plant metagenome]|uniref:Tricarboxylate transport protein TctC n=1 Tax=plant metagenome TaxID=1297885 RepID=A0A484YBX6_9ZZZZ
MPQFLASWRRAVALLCCACAIPAAASAATAGDYPNRPVRLVVGFPAGGGVDLTARLLAAELGKRIGQTVVVENRTGAAGAIGAGLVASAPADGYTLLLGNTGSITINPQLYPQLSYDPVKSFTPVGMVSQSPLLILVNPNSPAKDLAGFKAQAGKASQELTFGSGGAGSIGHLTGELFARNAGVKLVHVPYRGGSPAVTDLMGGQVDMVVEGIPISAPLVQTGKLRALLVTSKERLPTIKDVPTAAQAGMKDFEIDVWYGVLAPAGTPAEIVAFLNRHINEALASRDMQARLAEQGAVAVPGTPQALSDVIGKELTRWQAVVKQADVKVQ